MKTAQFKGNDYYVVPAPVRERCDGCHFENDLCNDLRAVHQCYEEWEDKAAEDRIFIPATDEAVAKWVNWRMNGFSDGSEDA